jgi:mannosyltransferase OCH1-like enzyme
VLSVLSWGVHHPGYALLLYDDADMAAYMAAYYPKFLPTYHKVCFFCHSIITLLWWRLVF